MNPGTPREQPRELTVLGQDPGVRADAARNREKILSTAEELLAERGVEALTMNAVAAAAGVGVGTVYRRFGDQAGLIEAMMNEHERRLQSAMMAGHPPLGPGAPPLERIRAFLHAYADLLELYGRLMAAAEAAMPIDRRYGTGAYAVHRSHLRSLIARARPETDASYLADALLAPLAAGLFVHQRREQGMTVDQIKRGIDTLLDALGPLHER